MGESPPFIYFSGLNVELMIPRYNLCSQKLTEQTRGNANQRQTSEEHCIATKLLHKHLLA